MKVAEARLLGSIVSAVSLLLMVSPCGAQELKSQQLTAPPPMKAIAREERNELGLIKEPKTRVRNSLELADVHLGKAEADTAQERFESASEELGKYWALIDDLLSFLSPMRQDSNKTRDLYKRVDLALRGHGPRLTAMRRITPLEYAVWIKKIEDFARNARTEALNSFYGQTVVRESKPMPERLNKETEKQSKDGLSAPVTKPPQ